MSSSSHGGGDPLASMLVSVIIVSLIVFLILMLIAFFVLFRCTVLIVRVFYKNPKNRALWISLGLCLLLGLTGGLLAQIVVSPGFLVLTGLGFVQLLITCKVVEIDNTTLFLREENRLADHMLHTSWWADYNA